MAFVAGQLGLGGAEQQMYYLACGLQQTIFDPLVISLGAQRSEYWEQPIARLGVTVVHVPRAAGRGGRVLRIASILRRARVQVVHAWAFHTNPYAAVAGRLAGVPVRVGSMRESYAGLPTNRLWRWAGLRGLDTLITNSRVSAASLDGHGLPADRVRVVPNGIVVPTELAAGDRIARRMELGLTPADRIVGTIGRLDRNKNHCLLLRACARLQQAEPGLRVVIIGDGPLRPELEEQASRTGLGSRVHVAGPIAGAARYLSAFDVCCLTSDTEGMPNVLMEASAAGVPVVATDCGGSRELIDHGVTGYLVARGDDADLAERIRCLLQSPQLACRLGHAGRSKMQREFSVDAMVAGITDVYHRQLARHTRASDADAVYGTR